MIYFEELVLRFSDNGFVGGAECGEEGGDVGGVDGYADVKGEGGGGVVCSCSCGHNGTGRYCWVRLRKKKEIK